MCSIVAMILYSFKTFCQFPSVLFKLLILTTEKKSNSALIFSVVVDLVIGPVLENLLNCTKIKVGESRSMSSFLLFVWPHSQGRTYSSGL